MIFEHDVVACPETDVRIHELLGKTGEPLPYSSDKATAKALAREMGLTVIPMHEPNYSHFFAAWGILPEEEPIGFLGILEVEPDEESDNLLLQHGWRSLSEAETLTLAVCRSVLCLQGAITPSGWVTTSEVADA